MASDESLTIHSYSMHDDDDEEEEEEEEEEEGEGDDLDYSHDTHHGYNMSRLSVCSGITDGEEEEEDAMMRMSRLSVEEGSEGEADGELSDGKEALINGSDSDKDSSTGGWFSLPATPRGRIQPGVDYASENEGRSERPRNRRRVRERWLERTWEMRKWKAMEEETMESGESECVVIAKPKGGGKSLCMDMEEVKACRDLGFDLQQPWTIEIPNSNRASGSTIDTDSGGTSPIANWRISSPGDDPRDVKARLKVWAQAVALASSRLNN